MTNAELQALGNIVTNFLIGREANLSTKQGAALTEQLECAAAGAALVINLLQNLNDLAQCSKEIVILQQETLTMIRDRS